MDMTVKTKTLAAGIAALTLGASLASCGTNDDSGGGSGSDMKMTVGYTAIGAAYSDLYVCEDKGIFKENGLDVELKLLNSSSQLLSALASKSVDVGAGIVNSTAAGALEGVDLDYVALPIPAFYMEMWGDPAIKSEDDLKGKKIGLSSPGSLGDTATNAWLEKKGWTEKDIDKTFLKSTPAEVTALKKGAVDAIVTQPPTGTQTREEGFKKVTDMADIPAAANAYTVTAGYNKENHKAVEAFVKSEVECLSILHNDRDAAVASIQKHSGNDDKALAEYSYDFFEPLWATKPTVDPALVQKSFDQAAAEKGKKAPASVTKYIDNSMVEDLDQSGFIDELYSK